MNFEESYFKSINYTNYLERGIRYKKMAKELVHYLKDHTHIHQNTLTLDYGCAVGFFTLGVSELGVCCDGYDISTWAANIAKDNGVTIIPFESRHYDIMFAFDVFEHMEDGEINKSLYMFSPNLLLIRIPCSINGKDFHLDVSRRDPTHINCKTKDDWLAFFKKAGFTHAEPIDLYTIYDAPGVMCYLFQR